MLRSKMKKNKVTNNKQYPVKSNKNSVNNVDNGH